MTLSILTTAAEARALGCTHHARLFGIIPGFCADTDQGMMWVPRSDLLAPLEWLLSVIWAAMRQMQGEEPDFMVEILGEIEGAVDDGPPHD